MADKISITICGDGGCGKSSITLRLVRSQWTHEYDPTIEDSYSVTRHVDGLPYFLSLTDTAGQEEYRGLWAASNLSSDAFLLVYDITQPSSLDNLSYFLDMIDIEAENRKEDNERMIREYRAKGKLPPESALRPMPVKIAAGNKCDLKDARVISSRQGLEWARARGCGFMETSAREKVNIEETFALIVRRVVDARRALPGAKPPQTSTLKIPQTSRSQQQLNNSSQSPISNLSSSVGGAAQSVGSGGGGAYTATVPLQMEARQMRSSPPPLPPQMNLEKSGFDDDEGRDRWWRRWARCGCFGGRGS